MVPRSQPGRPAARCVGLQEGCLGEKSRRGPEGPRDASKITLFLLHLLEAAEEPLPTWGLPLPEDWKFIFLMGPFLSLLLASLRVRGRKQGLLSSKPSQPLPAS